MKHEIIKKLPTKQHLDSYIANHKTYGNASDAACEEIISEWEAYYGQQEKVMVRARDEKGHFIKDDPSTPQDEAWVEKKSKKKG